MVVGSPELLTLRGFTSSIALVVQVLGLLPRLGLVSISTMGVEKARLV